MMSRKSKSAPFSGQHDRESVRPPPTWPDNYYWAPFSMCNRDRTSVDESSLEQTPGNSSRGGGIAGRDRQSQISAWNRSLPGPSSSSTIGSTNVAAASTPYRVQRPGPLMNDSLMAKVRFINYVHVCVVCVHVCALVCVCTVRCMH